MIDPTLILFALIQFSFGQCEFGVGQLLSLVYPIIDHMCPDTEVNTIWFSFHSKNHFRGLITNIRNILHINNISTSFLVGTQDYFCRDYMPVWVRGSEFVLFNFNPKYLNTPVLAKFRTSQDLVIKRNGFQRVIKSKIALDGGNIVRAKGRCILTDRVIRDNPGLAVIDIVNEIENKLSCEVILIPELPNEVTGHADGLIRFISNDTVLIHEAVGKHSGWHRKLTRVLVKNGFSFETIPFRDTKSRQECLHINYLEAGKAIIIPGSGCALDKVVFDKIRNLFPERNVYLICGSELIQHGGAFNCFSWGCRDFNRGVQS
ncbi:MAG: agmatine deiminase family protein [Spirochaetes bacterium]|nr:agmatine deiminase family protein [Spirochaetota bacterium]